MQQEWIAVRGFDGYYIHPLFGICNSKSGELLKGYVPEHAYPTVKLQGPDGPKLLKIHRLMAEAFVYNSDPANKTVVNHKDGNKLNYNVDNLEWVSESENNKHAIETGLRGLRKNGRSLDLLDNQGVILYTFTTLGLAAAYAKCTDRTIRDHLANRMRADGTILVKGVILKPSAPPPDLENETWALLKISVTETNDRFEISTCGRLRLRETKQHLSSNLTMGYPAVNMTRGDLTKTQMYIHRLMAFTYLSPTEEKFDVNHIDKDRTNNRLSNLEILNRKDHLVKDLGKPVLCRKEGVPDTIFPSISKAAEFLNVGISSVTKAIKKGSKCQGWNCYFVPKQ